MNAVASTYFGRSGMSPDDFEPTAKQIKGRAEYLKPLLLASSYDASDLLATQSGTSEWEIFARTLHAGDECEAGRLARAMLERAAGEEADRLANNELYRWEGSHYEDEDMRTLRRIGAGDVWAWLAEWER